MNIFGGPDDLTPPVGLIYPQGNANSIPCHHPRTPRTPGASHASRQYFPTIQAPIVMAVTASVAWYPVQLSFHWKR